MKKGASGRLLEENYTCVVDQVVKILGDGNCANRSMTYLLGSVGEFMRGLYLLASVMYHVRTDEGLEVRRNVDQIHLAN